MFAAPVRIEADNPYATLYPNPRVVTRDALHLIKALRSNGFAVVVEPETSDPVQYAFQKGGGDPFACPVVLVASGVALQILVNAIGSFLGAELSQMARRRERSARGPAVVIVEDRGGKLVGFDERGNLVSDEFMRELHQRRSDRQAVLEGGDDDWQGPGGRARGPIYLEHTTRIIGWGRVEPTNEGLRLDDGQIHDRDAWDRICAGELRGLSIGGVAIESTCSICRASYVTCNHIAGNQYPGGECTNTIEKWALFDVSIVREPVNEGCVFDLVRAGPPSS